MFSSYLACSGELDKGFLEGVKLVPLVSRRSKKPYFFVVAVAAVGLANRLAVVIVSVGPASISIILRLANSISSIQLVAFLGCVAFLDWLALAVIFSLPSSSIIGEVGCVKNLPERVKRFLFFGFSFGKKLAVKS